MNLLSTLLCLISFLLPMARASKDRENNARIVYYSSKEFDVFTELIPAANNSTTTVAKNSLFNAPLRDIHNPSTILGLITISQSNMLRFGYNVQNFVDTFHFLDSKYPGGSSITVMSSYASKSTCKLDIYTYLIILIL